MSRDAKRLKALQMLVLANACWGLSFPATKALAMSQQALLSTNGSWFIASLCVVYRFAIAALILLLISVPSLARLKLPSIVIPARSWAVPRSWAE